jgi:hypothetical protein
LTPRDPALAIAKDPKTIFEECSKEAESRWTIGS